MKLFDDDEFISDAGKYSNTFLSIDYINNKTLVADDDIQDLNQVIDEDPYIIIKNKQQEYLNGLKYSNYFSDKFEIDYDDNDCHTSAIANSAVISESLIKDAGEALNNLGNETYEMVDHPQHYGGKDNPYEAIKVIEAWNLNFNLGSCLKYISRAGKKPSGDLNKDQKQLEDLKKAAWYAQREVERFKNEMEISNK